MLGQAGCVGTGGMCWPQEVRMSVHRCAHVFSLQELSLFNIMSTIFPGLVAQGYYHNSVDFR